MRAHLSTLTKLLLSGGGLVGLPLLGFIISSQPIDPLLEFPPVTVTVHHASFSWTAFGILSLVIVGLVVGLLFLYLKGSSSRCHPPSKYSPHSFPWWGWASLTTLLVFWFLAWTRFSWFVDFQGLTFTPLWISFIVLLNALTYQRTGRCLLLNQHKLFLSLFLWSAIFWWYFEYLNRFIQNWRYIGLEPMTALYYTVHSTLAFSTVLPAVLSTCHLLQTFSSFAYREDSYSLVISPPRKIAWLLLALSSLGLLGLPVGPNFFFPFLWIAPLLFLLGIQIGWGESRLVAALSKGDWHVMVLPACAALLCGFFWEMWNYYSAAKWVYAIPWVDRFHLFEMPILGYAGYLPFGLECVVAVEFFANGRHRLDFMGWSNNRG